MEQPIRVLQIVTHMNRGGLETMLMNYYRHMDKNKIQFDFLTHRPEGEKKDYDDEIRSMGGKIYHMPTLNPFSKSYFNALRAFFKAHPEYKIVHSHLDCLSSYPLKVAKECGVPVRIAHAHTSKVNNDMKKLIKLYAKTQTHKYATTMFACSKLAGDWMFGNGNYEVFYNAIDVDKYRYNVENRRRIREELGISEDMFVIGHVGNFTIPKNHEFLLKAFAEVLKQKEAKLVLVGGGERQQLIGKMADELNIKDSVIFTGVRNDVPAILQSFDMLAFPSIYEGFPVSLVEAQAAGLRCLISENITDEVLLTPNIKMLSIHDSESVHRWTKEILTICSQIKIDKDVVIDKRFNIEESTRWLEHFYSNEVEKCLHG